MNNTLKSPTYLDGFYAGNMNCIYNLSIPDGKEMRLKFQSFDLVSDSECRIDYLNITNGIKEARYCGDQHSVKDLLVSGNYVVLTFHSDWLLENKKGFEILFVEEKESQKCMNLVTDGHNTKTSLKSRMVNYISGNQVKFAAPKERKDKSIDL
ncbi:unnamed protein product [Porites evermanni]|uniref:CUB domain-containing protein n=1 Tax=Porites evermanni TaxID=104178 RepID=A0ABN8MHF8_9CNID|nr:unnamed protein product [Porites evermanni]